MREPKPFVVGISWVVECTEQRRRVEEDNFIVDLEGLNVAGNNKVSYALSRCNLKPERLHYSAGVQCSPNTYPQICSPK